jgi:hypothetical protein
MDAPVKTADSVVAVAAARNRAAQLPCLLYRGEAIRLIPFAEWSGNLA